MAPSLKPTGLKPEFLRECFDVLSDEPLTQARDLPSSPLKSGEKRAAKWLELYGSEQTEIDALAALRPDELERIAREAVAPYFDARLAERVRDAEAAGRRRFRPRSPTRSTRSASTASRSAPKPRSTSSGKLTQSSRRSPTASRSASRRTCLRPIRRRSPRRRKSAAHRC
jgi:hypothetical protein